MLLYLQQNKDDQIIDHCWTLKDNAKSASFNMID